MSEPETAQTVSPAPKKKNWFVRHKILTAILVLIGLGIIISAAGGGSSSSSNSSTNDDTKDTSTKQEADTTPGIGEAARDGKFEFIVKGIECGKTEVVSPESDMLRKTAQGEFCLLTLNVKNIGDEQQYFSESDQKLLNAENQQFSPDSTATLYNSNNSDVFLAQINPGNSVEGVLVFDVPAGAVMTYAELHDSSFSNGVKVKLQ